MIAVIFPFCMLHQLLEDEGQAMNSKLFPAMKTQWSSDKWSIILLNI